MPQAAILLKSLTESPDVETDFRALVYRIEKESRQKIVDTWKLELAKFGIVAAGEPTAYDGTHAPRFSIVHAKTGTKGTADFSNSLASVTLTVSIVKNASALNPATTGSYTARQAAAKFEKLLISGRA